MIEVRNLSNYLGGEWVHKDINFTVNRREIVAIVGGSGSGKTTLLRSILMLLKPTSGSIKLFGNDIIHCSHAKAIQIMRRWGVTFQHNALFSSLTVLENVTFPLRVFTDLPPKVCEQIGVLKLSLAGLSSDACIKYPAELSGGMQKRAAIARAISLDPELLFLDEPTSGLDPKSAGAFDDLILHLRDTLNLTVVMVTHDLDSLWKVADNVAFLGEGRVIAQLPMTDMVKQQDPAIQTFFCGERGKKHKPVNKDDTSK